MKCENNNKRIMELIEQRDYDTLIKENESIIYYTMKRFRIPLEDQEDLIQECKIKLYTTAIGYDITKGSFSTYAVKSISNCIKMYYRSKNKKDIIYFNSISLNEKLDTDDSDDTFEWLIEDKILSTASVSKKRYFYLELYNAINSMKSQRKKEIIFSFLFDKNYNIHDLADKYNCPISCIRATIFRARQDIKNYLLDKGIDTKFFN